MCFWVNLLWYTYIWKVTGLMSDIFAVHACQDRITVRQMCCSCQTSCLSCSEPLPGSSGVQVVAAVGGRAIAVATLLLPGKVAAVQSGWAQAGHQLHVIRGKHTGGSDVSGWVCIVCGMADGLTESEMKLERGSERQEGERWCKHLVWPKCYEIDPVSCDCVCCMCWMLKPCTFKECVSA